MAAGPTYAQMATVTLSTPVSSVTFSSIPNSYTDLILVNQYMTSSNGGLFLQYNGDADKVYSIVNLISSQNTTPSTYATADQNYIWADTYLQGTGTITTDRPMTVSHIMNYANTSTWKTTLLRSSDVRTNDPTFGTVYAGVATFRRAAAIDTINILAGGGNFVIGSTFSLYGIVVA